MGTLPVEPLTNQSPAPYNRTSGQLQVRRTEGTGPLLQRPARIRLVSSCLIGTSDDPPGFSGGRTMLRVKLLGGAVVEGENGPLGGAAGQRKSLAVLGLLVAA